MGVHIFHLLFGNLTSLLTRNLSYLISVRYARALLDAAGLLKHFSYRRLFGDESERLVLVDSDNNWKRVTRLILCSRVKLFAKTHDVDASSTKRWSNRRCRGCLARRDLQTDCL